MWSQLRKREKETQSGAGKKPYRLFHSNFLPLASFHGLLFDVWRSSIEKKKHGEKDENKNDEAAHAEGNKHHSGFLIKWTRLFVLQYK